VSDIMTVATAPGGGGLMEHGRLTRAEIIQKTKEMAEYEKARMERILATPDSEFEVKVVRGTLVQHLIERLEP
jgi:hypothetical protein